MQLSSKETICKKSQSLFSGGNKKNIINLSSAEFYPGSDKSWRSFGWVAVLRPSQPISNMSNRSVYLTTLFGADLVL